MPRRQKIGDHAALALQLLSAGLPGEYVEAVITCTQGAFNWMAYDDPRTFVVYWSDEPQLADAEGLRWTKRAIDSVEPTPIWHCFAGGTGVFSKQTLPHCNLLPLVTWSASTGLRVLTVDPNEFLIPTPTKEAP